MAWSRIGRRGFGKLAVAAAAGLAAPRIARAAGELTVLAPEAYADESWVARFEELTGATVRRVAYAETEAATLARLQDPGSEAIDVLVLGTGSLRRYVEQALVQPLDPGRLRNRRNLSPAFRDVPALVIAEQVYGVPFAWGSLPLVYDEGAFPDGPPQSWAAMWDERHAQQMIVLDDANSNVTNAAILLGHEDPFNLSETQLAEVKARLVEQKKLLLAYYAGLEEGVDMFAKGGVKLMFAMGEPQVGLLRERGIRAAMTIPQEGAVGWLDCWAIAAAAGDVELAHQWVDVMLQREAGAHLTRTHGYANTTDGAANEAAGYGYAGRLVFLEAPEDFQKRVELWNEVKATPI